MPITFITFVIGSFSLAGFFPLAGFWSKDEILSDAWGTEKYLYYLALITAGLTAFYMTRAIFLTFFGEYRGGAQVQDDETHAHVEDDHPVATSHGATPHESPALMIWPLIILSVPAIFAGLANIDMDIEHLLAGALPEGVELHESVFRWNVAIASTIVPAIGVLVAYVIYGAKIVPSSFFARTLRPLHQLLENKYYFDYLYERVIVGTVFYRIIGGALETVDRVIVDGAVNGIGKGARQTANVLKYLQTGEFQTYGALAFGGLLVGTVLVLTLNPL
jgi:NADH:ubiquinone oxidoreductase subunit 5 (subunit L)/multisubunit Na+/H+ antiporter MnhA subunit